MLISWLILCMVACTDGSKGLVDADGDEYFAGPGDCDDTNPAIHEDAAEFCDALNADEDCDGLADDDDDDATGQTTFYQDADGDGAGEAATSWLRCDAADGMVADQTDCDDDAPDVNPSAVESCDGIDNDCDGLIDDQDDPVSGQISWSPDGDSDGFGAADGPFAVGCDPPEGHVTDSADCDDTRSEVNPDASEICDGLDDDCDGLVDDADDSVADRYLWYVDSDGDGFGDGGVAATLACEAPTGAVDDGSDCDDEDALVYPDAPEIIGDDVDQDCDGWDSPRVLSTADLVIEGSDTDYNLGSAVAAGGDIDGDGLDDLLMSATTSGLGASNGGVVYVFEGADIDAAGGGSPSPASTWTGESDSDNAGYGLSGGLDVDGDGYDDVAIGARSYTGDVPKPYPNGAAYLLFGPLAGLRSLERADAALYGDGERAQFANAVLALDLDLDGTAELVVGAPGSTSGDGMEGSVIVHSELDRSDLDDTDIVLTGASVNDEAGYSLARVDTSGDGAPDLVVGGPGGACAGACPGRVYSVSADSAGLPASGSLEDVAAFSVYDSTGALAGAAVSSAGDIDDDGAEDLMIGVVISSLGAEWAGAVYLITELPTRAGDDSMSRVGLVIRGTDPYGYLGYALSAAGDVDGDGQDDLLVGLPGPAFDGSDGLATRAGAALVIYGPVTDDITLTEDPRDLPNGGISLEGVTDGDQAGVSVAGVGDVNADGLSDVLIGAEYVGAAAGANTGAVYLVFGY